MSGPTATLVVIEDDPQIRRFLRTGLSAQPFRIFEAETGQDGLVEAATRKPDLVILDLGLPDLDGVDVVTRLRGWYTRPIIILSARSDEQEKIKALDAGADDYLTKPFDLLELQARLRALTRRAGGQAAPTLTHADVTLDPAARSVTREGQVVTLSAREYALLHDLLAHKGRIRARAELEESLYAWGEEVESNTVEVYIHHLRKKLGSDFIRTVRGLGYVVGDAA